MIEPNELRLGNWVYHNVWGDGVGLEWFKISALNENTVESQVLPSLRVIGIKYDKFVPVPLTPEILEKCGFKKTGENIDNFSVERYSINKFRIWASNYDPFFIYINYDGEEDDEPFALQPEIYSLHQLQNLFFALTGEELKIQL